MTVRLNWIEPLEELFRRNKKHTHPKMSLLLCGTEVGSNKVQGRYILLFHDVPLPAL